jgi:phosphoenolpyruvate carboxylase
MEERHMLSIWEKTKTEMKRSLHRKEVIEVLFPLTNKLSELQRMATTMTQIRRRELRKKKKHMEHTEYRQRKT